MTARRLLSALLAAPAAVALLGACASPAGSDPPARGPNAGAAGVPRTGPVMVAVGDIACRPGLRRTARACHHAATGRLALSLRPSVVALLGDVQYERGALWEFRRSFHPTWGRLKSRSRPAVGNHEYVTPGAAGYFTYFGAAAGPRGRGYYSYDVGAWHVVVLNSNCLAVACSAGSAQERWLRADLIAHRRACTLAYWHHPRFTSGYNRDFVATAPMWEALYDARAEIVLNGHDHSYERFGPQNPSGQLDLVRGIRQFTVGTGGQVMRIFRTVKPNSQRRQNHTFGVLALTLRPGGYDWRFVPEPGGRFTDAGAGRCH